MEKVGGDMVMDAYRAWRRVESDEAKFRMASAIEWPQHGSILHSRYLL